MATSGNFLTSDSGQGGGNFYGRMLFEWWQTGSGISGSVGYHNISYHLKTYGGSSGYYQYFYNGSMNVAGAGYSWGTTKAYGNGATSFGDYGNTIYTDSSGNSSFGASAQGGIFNNTINTSGSGSWGLDNIALYGALDSVSSNNITDEDSISATYHHYAGNGAMWLRLDDINGSETAQYVYAPGSPYTWSSLQTWAQTIMVNTNSTRFFLYYGDDLDANGSIDHWNGAYIGTISIKNDTGQANPTYSNFTYADTNTTTTAITGNNQYLIQGQSILQTTITAANAATAKKLANMDHYTYNIGGYSGNSGYSSSSTVTQYIGTVSDVTGAKTLTVSAVDSRGNSAAVTKTVNILPYAAPALTATATRFNGFDDPVILKINSAISQLTISSTDKNSVNATSGVQYRVAQDGADITAVGWTNVANTKTGANIAANNQAIVVAAQGAASSGHTFKIQVQITDKLSTTVQEINLSAGIPIFRIGLDRNVYNNEEQIMVAPMISILSDSKAAGIAGGTGTITPFAIAPLNIRYGTGVVNSSTVTLNVDFDFYSTGTGMRTWALKIDGNVIGNAARSVFIDTAYVRKTVSATIVATGLAIGVHTVSIEIYGGGSNVTTDTADFCTIVSTEWANAHVPSSTGAKYAGTVVDGGGSGVAWATTSNAQGVEDGNTAYVNEGPGGGGGFPNQLVSSNHGFAIPGSAKITGIMLEALVFGYSGAQDYSITLQTSSKSSTSTPNMGHFWNGTGALTWQTWGDSGSLWGRTDWTPTDINSPTFGASLSAFATHATSTDTVDAIRITVFYA